MRKVLSVAEMLKMPITGEPVRATADAVYNEEKGELSVLLAASDSQLGADVVRTKVDLAEAGSAAREIFQSWVHRMIENGQVCLG